MSLKKLSVKNLSVNLPTMQEIRQEKARRRLIDFTRYTYPTYLAGWCHELICTKLDQFLQDVIDQKSPRLMIFAPPRSGKTELVSRRFPAHVFGKYPDLSIIATSYASDLSSRNNRDVQRIIDDESYSEVFPDTNLFGKNIRTLSRGSYLRNSDIFEIVNYQGSYRSAGVGCGIGGMGAHILIVDDPIKDFKESRSKVVRDSIWEWFTSTAYTRLAPGGGIIIILTRWNEDDLAGRLIKEMDSGEGDKYKIITLQAIAEEDEEYRKKGEALHPDRYSLERLQAIQKVLGPYMWSALYQQDPKPGEGNIFNPAMMEIVDAIPAGTKFVRAWDFAASKDKGDYTDGFKLGKMPDGRYIIADNVRGQRGPEDVEKILKNTADRDGMNCKIRLPQDPGQAGKAQVKSFTKLLSGYSVKSLPVTGDKIVRAMPFAAQVNVGNVVMLRAAWNDDLISEFQFFPNGANDDQVDAGSDAFSEFNDSTAGMLDYMEAEAKLVYRAKLKETNPTMKDEELDREVQKFFTSMSN